jgi:xanthine dehydrogenase FAD-binding subunit
MKLWSDYVLAGSVDEALQALANAGGIARPIAGGTDLLLDLQQGRYCLIHTLVDITQIPELSCLELRGNSLFIGAGVPVSQIVRHPLVRFHAPAVVEACSLIGGPQVRNTATLGGNVAHALPAADGMISLVAMDAQVEVASADGRRRQPILSLFKGPGQSTLKTDREILTGFYLPLRQPGQASAFQRVMRPQGVALPILNLAASLERADGRFQNVRIAVGPAGPVPKRALDVEAFLQGKPCETQVLEEAAALLRSTMSFRTSARRATSDYRFHLSGVLLRDVLTTAFNRAESVEAI